MVFDAQSHHSPLTLPTLFYEILLDPTSPHFSPHNRPLPGFVKRKTQTFSKNVAVAAVWKGGENHRHRLYFLLRPVLPLAVCFWFEFDHLPRQRHNMAATCRAFKGCWQLSGKAPIPYLLIRAILFLQSFRSRSASHGMGYPSTRRDRPQLRDQLVRQRRTLALQAACSAHSCSARFPKRALSISSSRRLRFNRQHPCVHAR